jgi:uncharacterized protein (TIGR01244 family)
MIARVVGSRPGTSALTIEASTMNVKRPITPGITIGDQPTEEDLLECRYEGYSGIVNLRNDGEPEQPISTSSEGERVRALGMEYLHYGVGGRPLADPGVAEVCDFIDRLGDGDGKVLVHCRKGGRAMALVLIQQARLHGWSPEEAFEKGRAMGLQVDGQLKGMVEAYLAGKP